jgi:Gram-negative porin
MRNILLASVALLGGSVSLVHAQPAQPAQPVASPMQGQLIAPYGAGGNTSNNNNAWGAANTPTGSAAAGPLSTIRAPNIYATPTPGTLVIHLNGRVEADVAANFTTVDRGLNPNGTPNGSKLNPVGVASDIRLYFGADGMAANGVRYGAAIELWQNFGGATADSNPTSTANSGSANSSGQTVFVRKAFAYLASDQAGLVRVGGGEGIISMMDPCVFSSQCWDAGMGTLNGGGPNSVAPQGAMGIPWVFSSQSGADYATNKILYLSPQVYGFDLGVNYVPSRGNLFSDGAGANPMQNALCNQAGPECISVTSGDDATRWINLVGVALRYQHSFGAVDFKTYGLYEASGKEDLTTQAYETPAQSRAAFANGAATGINATQFLRYNDLGFYQAGVAVTVSNFTLAFDYMGGQVDGQLGLNPAGGAQMNAYVAGLTYANGPWILGAMVEQVDSQGDARLTGVSQRHEVGVAFGGNYRLAPGMQLVAEYQYEQRHQGGFDFNQGNLGVDGRTVDGRGQGILLGTVVNW